MKWESIENDPEKEWIPELNEGFRVKGETSGYIRLGLGLDIERKIGVEERIRGFPALRDDGFVVWFIEDHFCFQPQRFRFTSD